MIEQTEAERQSIEQAAAEQRKAEKRTAEVDAKMNRLLRGEQEAQREPGKAEKRLAKLAAAGDKEAAKYLAEMRQARQKPPSAGDRFNQALRESAKRGPA